MNVRKQIWNVGFLNCPHVGTTCDDGANAFEFLVDPLGEWRMHAAKPKLRTGLAGSHCEVDVIAHDRKCDTAPIGTIERSPE